MPASLKIWHSEHRNLVMGFFYLLVFSAFFVLTSCTRPLDSDFSGEVDGLRDDEIFYIQRIPASPDDITWTADESISDSLKIRTFNEPIFEQVVPVLIRDLLDGKITGYEDPEVFEEEKEIPDIREKLARLGVSRQDYSPFNRALEVLTIIRSGKGNYHSDPRYIRIIWKDPNGKLAEKSFASIRISDLTDYPIHFLLGGTRVEFGSYLRREAYYSYPVYVRSNSIEYTIASADEAVYLMNKVAAGHWDEVEWIGDDLNISGKKMLRFDIGRLYQYSGVIEFAKSEAVPEKRQVFLRPEMYYLVAEWSHRFKSEKLYPFDRGQFFSASGEILLFQSGDSILYISGFDTLAGILFSPDN